MFLVVIMFSFGCSTMSVKWNDLYDVLSRITNLILTRLNQIFAQSVTEKPHKTASQQSFTGHNTHTA